jgi:molybdopterin molybdotransferase
MARRTVIALEEAQSRLIALATPLPIETAPLIEAIGRWTAGPVHAVRTQPARDLSAMDGYAVLHADANAARHVIGESAAGLRLSHGVRPGEAARIFTGAVLPSGTDSVIIQEDVIRDGDRITVAADLNIALGQHVRQAGSDFTKGDLLIEAGERLTPARIALAAMGGHGTLRVRRRVRVALVSTGDELVPPGEPTEDDQIPSSNALMLAALLKGYDCDILNAGIVPDSLEMLQSTLQATQADIIVTIGGASVGDHDFVRPALLAAGASIDFWKVAMRPGKPLMAGRLGPSLVLGLPGNPVSAFVTATLFLKPLVEALSGAADPLPRRQAAILEGSLPPTGPRTDHVRARRTAGGVEPVGRNDSAALLSLARSDTLIVRPPDSPSAKSGDRVETYIVS